MCWRARKEIDLARIAAWVIRLTLQRFLLEISTYRAYNDESCSFYNMPTQMRDAWLPSFVHDTNSAFILRKRISSSHSLQRSGQAPCSQDSPGRSDRLRDPQSSSDGLNFWVMAVERLIFSLMLVWIWWLMWGQLLAEQAYTSRDMSASKVEFLAGSGFEVP